MKFEEQFPSLKGNECKYCRSPDVSLSFSIPEHWVGRLFDSEKIQEHCLDKQRVTEALDKFFVSVPDHSPFQDEFYELLKELDLEKPDMDEKKYIMGVDFAKGKDKTIKGNLK